MLSCWGSSDRGCRFGRSAQICPHIHPTALTHSAAISAGVVNAFYYLGAAYARRTELAVSKFSQIVVQVLFNQNVW